MSIYIQIATLEDNSITPTIVSALATAEYPKDIHIGVAATVGDEFFYRTVAPLRRIGSVNVRQFDVRTERGLGRGRINSRFAYNDEDYILQVDAHMLFQRGWDTKIAQLFNLAKVVTNNQKTLLTSYLGKYYRVGGVVTTSPRTGYAVWNTTPVTKNVPLRSNSVVRIADFPDGIVERKTDLFYPSNRVAGHFTFGNKHWAEFQGWTGEEIFWEEETTPAIRLLDKGFSLVYPNADMPITHRYWEDDRNRQVMDSIFDTVVDIEYAATKHIQKFGRENAEACAKYADYAGYDIVTDTLTYKTVVPQQYGF
jgi:hypothetical protein